MPNANGKITAPVNTDDVCAVLGLATHDVGYLCANSHGRINPWAKFKPIRFDSPAEPNDTQRQQAAYGFTNITKYTTPTALATAMRTLAPDDFGGSPTSTLFRYEAPDRATDWKRLGDFVGYNHNADAPFGPPVVDSVTFPASGTIGITFRQNYYADNDTVLLSDLVTNPSGMYFGMGVIVGETVWGVTQTYTLTDSRNVFGQVQAAHGGMAMGTYWAFAYLTSAAGATFQQLTKTSVDYIPLPFTRKQITFSKATVSVEVTSLRCYYDPDSARGLKWSFTVKNNGSAVVMLGDYELKLYAGDNLVQTVGGSTNGANINSGGASKKYEGVVTPSNTSRASITRLVIELTVSRPSYALVSREVAVTHSTTPPPEQP